MEQARKERVRKPDGVWENATLIPEIPAQPEVRAGGPAKVPAEVPEVVVEKVAEEAAGDNLIDQKTYRKEAIQCQDLTEQAPGVPGP